MIHGLSYLKGVVQGLYRVLTTGLLGFMNGVLTMAHMVFKRYPCPWVVLYTISNIDEGRFSDGGGSGSCGMQLMTQPPESKPCPEPFMLGHGCI